MEAQRLQQEKKTSSRKGDKPTQEWIYESRFGTLKFSLNYEFRQEIKKRGIEVNKY